MRLVDRVSERLRGRSVPVPSVSPWQEGQPYSREETAPDAYGDFLATSNDVYSCAWLRAKNLAKLPWYGYDSQGMILPPTAPLSKVLSRPNPFMTPVRVKATLELCLAIWGEAMILLERATPGSPPREMWPVKPTLVKAIPHRTDFISGYVYQPPGGGAAIPLRVDEVIHIQYPNPGDWYSPLSPMAAVRLPAEVASEAMKANRQLFRQGMMVGGFAMPPDKDSSYTPEQAKELEGLIRNRFEGSGQAHRWQVLRYFLNLKDMAVTPKDAEWIQGSNLTFRQVCRGMGVPPALVGDAEYATLANLRVYERALWEHTMSFEVELVGAEMTRQLVPAYQGAAHVALDMGEVVALQEDESERWSRAKDQISLGAITINEWREGESLEPVAWGDAWWAPVMVAPVSSGKTPPPQESQGEAQVRAFRRPGRLVEIEDALRDDLEQVTSRLRDAILQQLKQGERSVTGSGAEPFDKARWRERIRQACGGHISDATLYTVTEQALELGLTPDQVARLLNSPGLANAIEGLSQRFAHFVTETTWEQVRAAILEGAQGRETVDQIANRITAVMEQRVSDARRTAVTEITRASSTGQIAVFDAAGVDYKRWVTMTDGAVRETHQKVHGVEIPLGDLFTVGSAQGPGPGLTGDPGEDCGCRCILQPVRITTEGQ